MLYYSYPPPLEGPGAHNQLHQLSEYPDCKTIRISSLECSGLKRILIHCIGGISCLTNIIFLHSYIERKWIIVVCHI
jgi:hypothetical protein